MNLLSKGDKTYDMTVSVYNYTDFRKFLNDYLEYRKQKDTSLSLRIICKEIGLKSAGHLSYILQGKTNLSKKIAANVTEFCRMKKSEAEYFLAMVMFNQTKSHTKKKENFEKLVSFRMSCVYKVSAHSYKYYDKWYHSALRSLTGVFDVRDNYAEVGTFLMPTIRDYQVKSSLKLLEELKLIKLDKNGFFRPTSGYIDTGSHPTSTAVNNFLVSMLDKAKESLDRFPGEERKLAWVTMATDKDGYDKILQEFRKFRCKVADILEESKAERVFQMNMQLFPLSKARDASKWKE
ncbi:MAG: TIGR02147 family protein [Fibrobacteria bacterium]|nr:TIGR02147 family protein [Fibrobacteria bacterium]